MHRQNHCALKHPAVQYPLKAMTLAIAAICDTAAPIGSDDTVVDDSNLRVFAKVVWKF